MSNGTVVILLLRRRINILSGGEGLYIPSKDKSVTPRDHCTKEGEDQINGGMTGQMGGRNGQGCLDEETCLKCGSLDQEALEDEGYLPSHSGPHGAWVLQGVFIREEETLTTYIVRICGTMWNTRSSSSHTSAGGQRGAGQADGKTIEARRHSGHPVQ